MEILDIRSRDVFCIYEISLSELKDLKLALENCELHLDLNNAREEKASSFVHKILYPFVVDTIERIEGNEFKS